MKKWLGLVVSLVLLAGCGVLRDPQTGKPPSQAPTPTPSSGPTATPRASQPALPAANPSLQAAIKASRQAQPEVGLDPLGADRSIRAASFLNADNGWLVWGAALIFTQDGGKTWETRTLLDRPARSLSFITADLGYLLLEGGLETTRDGGRTWSPLPLPEAAGWSQVAFVDEKHGWLAGDGKLAESKDGGLTWTSRDVPCAGVQKDQPAAIGLSFATPYNGYLICTLPGEGHQSLKWLYRTWDGGAAWHLTAQSARGSIPSDGVAARIAFFDLPHGWLALSKVGLYETWDGGKNWSLLPLPMPDMDNLAPVWLGEPVEEGKSPRVGLLAGGSAKPVLLRTEDAGDHWRQVFPPALPDVWHFIDARVGFGAGSRLDDNALMFTSDGGVSWLPVQILPGPASSLDFCDSLNGWVISGGSLFATEDGGRTWQRLALPFTGPPVEIVRQDVRNGWVRDLNGNAARTGDGGQTWQMAFTLGGDQGAAQGATLGQYVSTQDGWRIASGQIQVSRDGGQSWAGLPLAYRVNGLARPSSSEGWVLAAECDPEPCRPLLLLTGDGGQTWEQVILDGVDLTTARMQFVDEDHGWLEDSRGVFLRTQDGGATWDQIGFK